MEQTVILKQTPEGLAIDTIVNSKDSLPIKADSVSTIFVPRKIVNDIKQEKSGLDNLSTWVVIVCSIIGATAGIISMIQFFRNKHTKELKEQNRIKKEELRLRVKPRIWNNGGGWRNERITIDINNRGELAFYDKFQIMEGDKLEFSVWRRPIELPKDGQIILSAPYIDKRPAEINFVIKIFYHDQENNNYETIFNWNGGRVTLIETIEK